MVQNKNIPMEETKKEVSAEELAAEQAALQESKEDEIRSKVIAEFGFDEVDDVERIDKLVVKELGNRKKLSEAIGQKIKWRTEANKPKVVTPLEVKKDNVLPTLDVNKVVAEEFEKREIDSLEYSEPLKKEISDLARFKNLPVKQILRDPYIVSRIKEDDAAQEVEKASITRTNRSGSKKSYSFDSPPDVDMSTAEGRAEWDKYTADMKKKGY